MKQCNQQAPENKAWQKGEHRKHGNLLSQIDDMLSKLGISKKKKKPKLYDYPNLKYKRCPSYPENIQKAEDILYFLSLPTIFYNRRIANTNPKRAIIHK